MFYAELKLYVNFAYDMIIFRFMENYLRDIWAYGPSYLISNNSNITAYGIAYFQKKGLTSLQKISITTKNI